MKVSKKTKATVGAFASVAGGVLVAAPSTFAANHLTDYANQSAQTGATGNGDGLMKTLQGILSIALGVIGFISVIMIVVGGLQYTTSSGDTSKVTKAKNTIMYGVIGLVISILAYAIVNFVLNDVLFKD